MEKEGSKGGWREWLGRVRMWGRLVWVERIKKGEGKGEYNFIIFFRESCLGRKKRRERENKKENRRKREKKKRKNRKSFSNLEFGLHMHFPNSSHLLSFSKISMRSPPSISSWLILLKLEFFHIWKVFYLFWKFESFWIWISHFLDC